MDPYRNICSNDIISYSDLERLKNAKSDIVKHLEPVLLHHCKENCDCDPLKEAFNVPEVTAAYDYFCKNICAADKNLGLNNPKNKEDSLSNIIVRLDAKSKLMRKVSVGEGVIKKRKNWQTKSCNSEITKAEKKEAALQKNENIENDVLKMILEDPVELDLAEDISTQEETVSVPPYINVSGFINYSKESFNDVYNNCSSEESDNGDDRSFKRLKTRYCEKSLEKSSIRRKLNFDTELDVVAKEILDSESSSKHDTSSISSLSSSHENSTKIYCNRSKESVISSKSIQKSSVRDDLQYSMLEISQKGSLKEVIECIEKLRSNDEIQQAICWSANYIPISPPDIRKKIFQTLFKVTANQFKEISLSQDSEFWRQTFHDIFKIWEQNNLYDKETCSVLIISSFHSNINSIFLKKIFEQIKALKIPIVEQAIQAYADYLVMPKDLSDILSFLDYLKEVCCSIPPRELLHKLLLFYTQNFQSISRPELNLIFNVFCNHDCIDINDQFMINFLKTCIKQELWTQINNMFCQWVKKTKLRSLHCFIQALAFPLKEAGIHFEKFAASMFRNSENISKDIMAFMGQIGINLMFETYVRTNLDVSLAILVILHQYNISYLELQIPISTIYNNSVTMNPSKLLTKDSVFYTVIDILLHHKRNKDAFNLYKGFNNVLDIKDIDLKRTISLEYYYLLLRIAYNLIESNSFDEANEALHDLLRPESQGLTLESLEHKYDAVRDIYCSCLTNFLNKGQLQEALNLVLKKYGPLKNGLKITEPVGRGLIVLCVLNGRRETAHKIFNICQMTKRQMAIRNGKLPLKLFLESTLSTYEMKLLLESHIKELHPFLLNKDIKCFKQWFQIKIKLKERSNEKYKIDCLRNIHCDLKSSMERVMEAIHLIDPDLRCAVWKDTTTTTRDKSKTIEINADSFYRYWKFKYCTTANSNSKKTTIKLNFKKDSELIRERNESDGNIEDFEKISTFLLAKVKLKHPEQDSDDQKLTAKNLALYFIRNNQGINKLDKKYMKLLNEFAETEIN